MAEDLPSRTVEREIINEQIDAEAASRRAESEASVMRSRAMRHHAVTGLSQIATDAAQRETDAAKAAQDAAGKQVPVDPEGTMPSLSDRTGTFATDLGLVTAGGVGIDDSNRSGETNAANLVHPEGTADATQGGTVGGAEIEGETAAQRKARLKAGAG